MNRIPLKKRFDEKEFKEWCVKAKEDMKREIQMTHAKIARLSYSYYLWFHMTNKPDNSFSNDEIAKLNADKNEYDIELEHLKVLEKEYHECCLFIKNF